MSNDNYDDDDDEEFQRKPNAIAIWGNEKTMNLNSLLLTNIQSSHYFKVNLFSLKTYHEVIDEIYYNVGHMEPWEKGSRKAGQTGMCGGVRGVGTGGIVSTAFSCLYKLFTLRLTRKQINGLLNHADSPYIRGVGFLYLRYTQNPADLFGWFEPYLLDEEIIDIKAGGGEEIAMGQMCRRMLTKLDWYGTLFPRIPVPIEMKIQKMMKERFPMLAGGPPDPSDRRTRDPGDDRRPRDVGDDRRPRDAGDDRRPRDVGDDRRPRDAGDGRRTRDADDDRRPCDVGDDRRPRHAGDDRRPRDAGDDRRPRDAGDDRRPRDAGDDRRPRDVGDSRKPRDGDDVRRPRDAGDDRRPRDGGETRRVRNVAEDRGWRRDETRDSARNSSSRGDIAEEIAREKDRVHRERGGPAGASEAEPRRRSRERNRNRSPRQRKRSGSRDSHSKHSRSSKSGSVRNGSADRHHRRRSRSADRERRRDHRR